MRNIRRIGVVAAAVAALAFVTSVPAQGAATAQAASAAPYCGITWGSLPKQASLASPTQGQHVTGVRAGRHTCYDRLVVDVAGPVSGYSVRYVDVVRGDATGTVVPLRGGARLQVVVVAPAYDVNTGRTTYRPANPSEVVGVAGYSTFRQVAWAETFEGQTTLGLGVRARLPFRVFVLAGPGTGSRVVVDVAHRW